MRIFQLAIRSLKMSKQQTLFYLCSYILTTFFIFSFFSLAFNPATGIHLGAKDTTFTTSIAVLVIAVAMFCVFLANDFYISHKNKELSVMLMSGASVYRLSYFLFIQSFIIMCIAIPVGLILGYLSIPFVNMLFQNVFAKESSVYVLSQQTIIATFVILICEVVWCTILNVGYCYRNSVHSVLHEKTQIEGIHLLPKKLSSGKFYPILYLGPLAGILLTDDYGLYLMFSVVAIAGIPGLIKTTIPHLLTYFMHHGHCDDFIAFSFVKEDLKNISFLINLMTISSLLLMSIVFFHLDSPLISMVTLVSYAGVQILLSMTLMFKFGMSLTYRNYNYQKLNQLGFIKTLLKRIMKKELFTFFMFILGIPFLYQCSMLFKLLITKHIQLSLMILLLTLEIIPIMIVFILCYQLYQKNIHLSLYK